MIFVSRFVPAGTPVPAPHLFEAAHAEFLELGVMDRKAWVGNALAMHSEQDHWQIGILVDGKAVGGVCFCAGFDPHVGECAIVLSNYVLPEYRSKSIGFRCFREVVRVATRAGFKMLAYTHREKDWVYRTIYRRL